MTAVITTKARKYQESVGKFRQNRLFQNDQRQFYRELNQEGERCDDNLSDAEEQVLTYEACDCTRMPLHMPKTLETCKKRMPFLIQKASRCAADRTSKTTFFIFHFL